MNKNTKIALLVIIVLFIAGMAFYPTLRNLIKKEEDSKSMTLPGAGSGERGGRTLNVNAEIVRSDVLKEMKYETGKLIPDEEVSLSFETSGKITDIFFKEGSSVKKGDLLAKVNDKPLQAELKKLLAQIPLTEDRVYRQKALLEKDAVSKEAYEQVMTELEKLNADIELVKARIAQTELRAPFDGEIGLRLVSEGSYASPTTVVATLTKIIPLKIEFSVNEKYAGLIKNGTPLTFRLSAKDNEKYNASVYALESSVDPNTLTLKVRAIYPNANGALKPGRSVSIELNYHIMNEALTVPSEAIIPEMGRDIVYIYSGGKAKQMEITKGLRTESRVQVTRGLHAGDTLITTGVMQLRDGIPVKIDNKP